MDIDLRVLKTIESDRGIAFTELVEILDLERHGPCESVFNAFVLSRWVGVLFQWCERIASRQPSVGDSIHAPERTGRNACLSCSKKCISPGRSFVGGT